MANNWVPAYLWLLGAKYALREDQIDDIDQQNTGVDQDIGCDGKSNIVLPGRPDNAQD